MISKLLTTSLLLCFTASTNVFALDARSVALGGSAISNGDGVHGALENPASLMHMQNSGKRGAFHVGASLDLRDSADFVGIAEDNENLRQDFDTQIDLISGQTLGCDILTATADTVCLTNTTELGDLSSRVLGILNDVDDKELDGQAVGDIGMAMTSKELPFAVHFRFMATALAAPNIAQSDKDYTSVIADTLQDGSLTFGEITDNIEYAVDTNGTTLELASPENTLQSDGEAAAILRTQLGVSFARTFTLDGRDYDMGITPKISRYVAGYINASVADQFDDDSESLADLFDDSEVDGTSLTFDYGVSTDLTNKPIRLSAVIQNVIGDSIKFDSYSIDTTPQLIVGGSYRLGNAVFNADIALNKAKTDNFESQKIGLGVEWAPSIFVLRAGISHDDARSDAATALSAGFGIGPFNMGARLAESQEAQFSAQLSHSF